MDGLKRREALNLVARLRNIAIAARTPKIAEILKGKTGLTAILDQETRWGSTWEMIDRLIRMKVEIQNGAHIGNTRLELDDAQWKQADDLHKLLLKCYLLTKKCQLEDLTAGYFFR